MGIYHISQAAEGMYDDLGHEILDIYDPADKLIWSRISELTGDLPLSFQSRAEHVLSNYQLHGTSEGSGVETVNIFDKNAKEPTNGYAANYYLAANGSMIESTGYSISEYIPVLPNTEYTIDVGARYNNPSVCIYDDTKSYIEGFAYSRNNPKTITTGSTAKYIRISLFGPNASIVSVMKSSDLPDPYIYIPYGYKIPLTNTSGQNTDTYPLYIGSTKLGAEEYVDYAEQKVYKRTENLFNKDATGTIYGPGYNLAPDAAEWRKYSGTAYTYRIPCEGNANYTLSTLGHNNVIFRIATVNTDDVPASTPVPTNIIYYGNNISRRAFTTPSDAKYIIFQGTQDADRETVSAILVLIKGSTPPASYIPYLQPTDPPAPLPKITAYQGENTLSSTETVGEVTIAGRIKETPNP